MRVLTAKLETYIKRIECIKIKPDKNFTAQLRGKMHQAWCDRSDFGVGKLIKLNNA